jgi:hypothetical protein
VLDLLDAETGRRLVLDDESLDLVVREIARPDDGEVAPRRVADPTLLSVENPAIASRFAVVVNPPLAPEPTSGSVNPKHPIFS